MSQQNTIEITSRIAKRTANVQGRKKDLVPAVVYGPKQESTSIFISNRFFVFNGTNEEDNTLYTLAGGGLEGSKVMIKRIMKNPIGNKVLHVDLYAPDMTKAIKVEVEIDFQGEPEGVKEGGLLQVIRRTIEVECPITDIPESIALDISAMKVGDTLKMGEITVSEKYKVISAPEYAVVSVIEAAKEEEVVAAPAEGDAAAAPAEGDAAAPAADAPKAD